MKDADDDYGALYIPDAELPFRRSGFRAHREQIDFAGTLPLRRIQYGHRANHVHESAVMYDWKPATREIEPCLDFYRVNTE